MPPIMKKCQIEWEENQISKYPNKSTKEPTIYMNWFINIQLKRKNQEIVFQGIWSKRK